MASASASSSVGMMSSSCDKNKDWWNSNSNSNSKGRRTKGVSVRVRIRVSSASSSVMDPYKTLRIQPGASESEVKKAFRQLALKYHPDVCRGSNSGIQFQTIFEAYDMVMDKLRESEESSEPYYHDYDDQGIDEPLRGRNDPDYDMWEEWMGWEGAGIRDYSSHINPYI